MMRKKILSAFLVLLLILTCVACQNNNESNDSSTDTNDSNLLQIFKSEYKLTQEQLMSQIKAEYLKNNPDAYIKGYEESRRAYLEKQKKADIFTALPEQAKETINYLRNCSKQLANNIMKFVNE